MPRRYPQSVYGHGEEPDPRFSLANERTFLSWTRTSLALFASGVALEALQLPIRAELRFIAAVLFICLGLAAIAQGWFGWMRAERAMREGRPLPGPTLGPLIAVGIVLGVGLVAVGLFL